MDKESLKDFINRMRVTLTNATSNEKIAAGVALFGYDAAKIAEGVALLDALVALTDQQMDEYAEQYAATNAANAAWEKADTQLGIDRAIAKRLFVKDVLAQGKLLLKDKKPERRGDWLLFASHFYSRLLENPTWLAQMGQYGRSQTILTQGLSLVKEVETLTAVQQDETAEAQAATKARDEIWGQARVWLATFLEIATFALADDPQLLESFQKVVPS